MTNTPPPGLQADFRAVYKMVLDCFNFLQLYLVDICERLKLPAYDICEKWGFSSRSRNKQL